ncbi:MAG: peptidylprolyl isomerase [Bacteroidota bacterium]
MPKALYYLIALFLTLPLQLWAQKSSKFDELVVIETTLGDITLLLYDQTPGHKANFLKLVKEGFYDGTTFHRVIKDFMIQGGDPFSKDSTKRNSVGQGGPGYTQEAEFVPGLHQARGVVAAARMPDQVNPNKESSGSQFYLIQGRKFTSAELDAAEQRVQRVLGPDFKFSEEARTIYQEQGGAPWLDQQYTIFGEIIEGLAVVDRVAEQQVDRANRPLEDITVSMRVEKMKRKKVEKEFGIEYPSEK